MDAYYYLMAQVPALVRGQAPLMGSGEFLELCGRLLPPGEGRLLTTISLTPPDTGEAHPVPLVSAWYAYESSLRDALASLRAPRLSKQAPAVRGSGLLRSQHDARSAMAIESPLEAELFLLDKRMEYVDELQGSAWFDRSGAAAWLLKTLLLERRALFREEEGFAEYKRIYSAIMEGAVAGKAAPSSSTGSGEQA